jgi:deoxyribodipyrimidine photo-lyase
MLLIGINWLRVFYKAGAYRFFHLRTRSFLKKDEVLNDVTRPYTVFTPYCRKWKTTLTDYSLKSFTTEKYFHNFFRQPPMEILSLSAIGFKEVDKPFPSRALNEELIERYAEQRNFPAVNGTSKLGIHLRFGTISIRELASKLGDMSATY